MSQVTYGPTAVYKVDPKIGAKLLVKAKMNPKASLHLSLSLLYRYSSLVEIFNLT